jgi:hypothetical protein
MQRIGMFCALKDVMTIQRQPFADFMRERELALRRFATVLTGDPSTSEEIVVDVLSRAWEKWEHIGDLEQPNAYVRRMIVNEYLSSRRRLDDLHQAFARLEARTPLTIDAQPSGTATIVELVPATATQPGRRAALIGSGAAVAATIAGAILVTGLSGGSGRTHVPAGGTVAPATSAGAPAAAPSVAAGGPSTVAAPSGAWPYYTCSAGPNGVAIQPCVSPTATTPIPQSSLTRAAP